MMGAAMMVSCFFAEQNVGYRGTLLLLVLPALLLLGNGDRPTGVRRFAWISIAGVLIVMDRLVFVDILQGNSYNPVLTPLSSAVWIGFEALWWYVIAALTGLLITLLAQSVTFAELLSVLALREEDGTSEERLHRGPGK
jgi:hypothetical protein